MDVGESVHRHAQKFIESHEEDRATLKGWVTREYHHAYERLMWHVYHEVYKELEDWREWEAIRPQVVSEVQRLCSALRLS